MQWKVPKVYAVKHCEEKVIVASRSGGIFTAVSDLVLDRRGVVYGCVLTDDFKAVHARAENAVQRDLMRKSKYVQSDLGDTYKQVKQDLLAGRAVLFSGTSCQVAGLRNYLGAPYENLFCVDIVCHGVPSPKAWEAYLQWQEKKHRSKVVAVDFRNKKDYGWRAHVEKLWFQNGHVSESRVFANLFFEHSILRPSCYECPYKSTVHPGDITLADYWGIEKAAPEFDDNKGVSLVLVNNEAGEKIFESVKEKIRWKETRLEDSMQPALEAPFPAPENRAAFWSDFFNRSFDHIAKKYAGAGVLADIKLVWWKLKRKWQK